MNKINLVGRTTRDIEMRYSQGAEPVAVARFGLAVNRVFKKQGEADADFFNLVAFGKKAELCEKYLKKGDQVAIVGRVQVGSYEDKAKVKHTSFDVIVEDITLLNNGKTAGTGAEQQDEDNDLPF